jgi:hypothetical protein
MVDLKGGGRVAHMAVVRVQRRNDDEAATVRRGGETQDQPRNRHVPTNMRDMTIQIEGLGWHDPDHAPRGAPVVGSASHSYGYGVVFPPRIWGRGIPGTPPLARVAAHPPFKSPF